MPQNVEPLAGAFGPCGVEERVADRDAHVGRPELRLDRAVLEFDHRVHDRLRVQHHVDPFGGHVEEPAGLDDLETLVHERRGVDGDLGAHRPLGMAQRLFRRDVGERLARYVAQRAARAGDDEPPRCRAFAREALEYGRMLRVDRQDRSPVFGRHAHDVFAAHHERLLVGQGQFLAGAERRDRGGEARIAHQGIDHDLGAAGRRDLGHGLLAGVDLGVGVGQRVAQRGIAVLVGDDDRVGIEFAGLLCEQLPAAARREDAGFEEFGILAHDVERLHADRARGTQYGKSLSHVRIRCNPPDRRVCRRSTVRIRRAAAPSRRLRPRRSRSLRPRARSVPP